METTEDEADEMATLAEIYGRRKGSASPKFSSSSAAAAAAAAEDSEDDTAPLAQVYGLRKISAFKKFAVAADDSSDADDEKRARKATSSPNPLFKKGDLVWAKAFAYAWWPAQIVKNNRNSTRLLVSFFGSDKTRWFSASTVLDFERNYARISKMVGAKLSDPIDSALDQLTLRTFSALSCPCRRRGSPCLEVSPGRADEEKKGFKPREMLGLVLDLAVSAWVDHSEAVGAFRAAAQVDAYRRYVSVSPDEFSVGDGGISSLADNPAQPDALLQTVHVTSDSSSEQSEGTDMEVSDSSSEDEVINEVSREPEHNLSVDILEEVSLEQVQGCSDICMVSRVVDLDGECESLLSNSNDTVTDVRSTLNFEEQNPRTGSPAHQTDVNPARDEKQSEEGDDNHNAYDGSVFHASNVSNSVPTSDAKKRVSEADLRSLSIIQSRDNARFSNILTSTSVAEMANQYDKVFDDVKHEFYVPAAHTGSSSLGSEADAVRHENFCLGRNSSRYAGNDIVFHRTAEPMGSLPTYDADDKRANKADDLERDYSSRSDTCNNFKLQKIMIPDSEAAVDTSSAKKQQSSTCHNVKSYNLNLPKLISKSTLLSKGIGELVASAPSGWHGLYASPLVRDSSNSTSKAHKSPVANSTREVNSTSKAHKSPVANSTREAHMSPVANLTREARKSLIAKSARAACKSPGANKSGSFPKSLHMKFPKDFELPSKEEVEKKFRVFGLLDRSRTQLFASTGSGRVVYLHEDDAKSAYKYVKKMNVFGQANVRFWLDAYETFRKSGTQGSAQHSKKRSPRSSKTGSRDLPSSDETYRKSGTQDSAQHSKEHSHRSSKTGSRDLPSSDLKSHSRDSSMSSDLRTGSLDLPSLDLKSQSRDSSMSDYRLSSLGFDPSAQTSSSATMAKKGTSLNPKSCLKTPGALPGKDMKEKHKVRFTIVTD